MRKIGITIGDPLGIGPELVSRCLPLAEEMDCKFVIYGHRSLLKAFDENRGLPSTQTIVDAPRREPLAYLNIKEFDLSLVSASSEANKKERAQFVLKTLDAAIEDARTGYIDALVTAPIDKSVVNSVLPSFMGHTEYLATKGKVEKTLMMMDNTELRIVLLTNHIAIRKVPNLISADLIQETVRLAKRSFSSFFGLSNPRFALLGLNPHAGELEKRGEETRIFLPAIQQLKSEGFLIDGPFPADSFFPMARKSNQWDVILSPFHDQGLVAAKYAGLEKVVNITLGLPFLRVSPGHGVAYDIVGKNMADSSSFERSIRIAVTGRLTK